MSRGQMKYKYLTGDGPSRPITDMNDPTDNLTPALFVHLDQSPAGVLKRIRLLNGDRTLQLLNGRVRVINFWRPITTVDDWPLALCDGSTMSYDELLGVDLVRRDYVGSTMYAKYKPGYKRYYLEKQKPSEVCLFKNFDSSTDVPVTMCPHVSFAQDNAPGSPRLRESIEIRAFVYTKPRGG
ncbi:hypothetical protein B0T18DRAFT_390295 [Schizothecium vesticola]|uniref:Uncharacterized protein n=1 Tax=Schizothecium vesticola TaxID=314040 RepID=A0AA40EUK8_9PEZI|nr:hypothetical protein B0T18DRAFT_390295 [Schizothecium vesticola]